MNIEAPGPLVRLPFLIGGLALLVLLLLFGAALLSFALGPELSPTFQRALWIQLGIVVLVVAFVSGPIIGLPLFALLRRRPESRSAGGANDER